MGVYLASMGNGGIRNVATQCYSKAHYMAGRMAEAGFTVKSDDFFHEFVTESDKKSSDVLKALEEK